MVDSELSKLVQYKINGQTKPFVDHNLQIQIPEIEADNDSVSAHSVYSHYSAFHSSNSSSPSSFNEAEFAQAMQEAKQSYDAWKKMGAKLEKEAEKYIAKK